MGFAPELPTTETLQQLHPLTSEGRQKVYEKRKEVTGALKFGEKLLAIIGPCAMTDNPEAILEENRRIAEFGETNNLVMLHRLPPWKPRTNPDSWFGLETTDPEGAYRQSVAIAEQSGNLAMEFGHEEHIRRYLGQAALAWRGSRNDNANELLRLMVGDDQTVPVAIKNGMNGTTEAAAKEALDTSATRKQPGAAPVVMIYRGGDDLRTVPEWVDQYAQAFFSTKGGFIVDVAHGGEMAHDPSGQFKKSAMGQVACLGSVMSIATTIKKMPRGVMIETSDIPSPTDPVVPLDDTFRILRELSDIHARLAR